MRYSWTAVRLKGFRMAGAKNLDIEKLRLVREVATSMVGIKLSDLNLLLHESGLPEFSNDDWLGDYNGNWQPDNDDRRTMSIRAIRDLDSSQLENLGAAMHQLFDTIEIKANQTAEPHGVKLFASHLTTQRRIVEQVAESLLPWGVSLFVAHADIEPEDEWHVAIESSLRSVNGGVIFMYPGFAASQWCDQEVGWLLGREVPVRTLMFNHEPPHGPLSKRQAYEVPGSATATDLAKVILDWISQQPVMRPYFNASLAEALAASRSFDRTDQIWGYMRLADDLTAAQVARVASAIRDNDQVYGGECRIPGEDYKTWFPALLVPFLLKQPGYASNRDLVAEVASARDLIGLIESSPTTNGPAPDSKMPF